MNFTFFVCRLFRFVEDASSPYSGSYAYAIGNLASGALQSASIAVSGNKQYDLYAWVNGKLDAADSAGGWHVRALYYTAGSAYIGYKDVYTGTAESSSLTWQQVGGRLLTPANAASVRLELRVEGVSGWLDFDDVSLQEVLTVNLVYNAENRLVKVLQGGTSTAAFGYDGDGVRVKQVLTTTTATSTYFVKNYYEVSGGSATKYYYLGSQRVAMRSSVGVRYLFGDHLGSTSVIADASGGNVTRQLYKGWGEIRYTSGSLPAKYQYTGQYSYATGATADFGLIFYNARFYDPALGRFTQADTIVPGAGNPAAWDRYAGMLNNPVRYRDPSGHEACDEDGNCFDNHGREYHIKNNRIEKKYITWMNPIDDAVVRGGYDFGEDNNTFNGHNGVDINPPPYDIHASGYGTVISSDPCNIDPCTGINKETNGGYGNMVVIEYDYFDLPLRIQVKLNYGDSLLVLYGHMAKKSTLNPGDHVYRGQNIGIIGSTGNSSGNHLHLETRQFRKGEVYSGEFYPNRTNFWVNKSLLNPHEIFTVKVDDLNSHTYK